MKVGACAVTSGARGSGDCETVFPQASGRPEGGLSEVKALRELSLAIREPIV